MNLSFTIKNIASAAAAVWQYGKQYPVWAFHAPMGAGKTTFIHTLCSNVLEVNGSISSPTFAIINEYKSNVAGVIYHMDWYRLTDEAEALQAGVEDCLLSGCYCFVEWPDIAASLLPPQTMHIYIRAEDEDTRLLHVG